jgi:hypothetical protein
MRDAKGRFVKGHGWTIAMLQKISQTKTKAQTIETSCKSCQVVFSHKEYNRRVFCSQKCRDTYGSRTGMRNTEHQKETLSKLMAGSGNHRYINGSTRSRIAQYRREKYTQWRKSIFERDDYTCQSCFIRPGKGKKVVLNADHIVRWSLAPELRFELSNGQTLCRECHLEKTRSESREHWKNQYSQ